MPHFQESSESLQCASNNPVHCPHREISETLCRIVTIPKRRIGSSLCECLPWYFGPRSTFGGVLGATVCSIHTPTCLSSRFTPSLRAPCAPIPRKFSAPAVFRTILLSNPSACNVVQRPLPSTMHPSTRTPGPPHRTRRPRGRRRARTPLAGAPGPACSVANLMAAARRFSPRRRTAGPPRRQGRGRCRTSRSGARPGPRGTGPPAPAPRCRGAARRCPRGRPAGTGT